MGLKIPVIAEKKLVYALFQYWNNGLRDVWNADLWVLLHHKLYDE